MKKIKKTKVSKSAPKKGDTYTVNVDVSSTDIDGDGITDLSVVSETLKNGELFQTATIVWYGLDDNAISVFENILAAQGIKDETITVDKFNKVVKIWKKQISALKDVNEFGKDFAGSVLGETEE